MNKNRSIVLITKENERTAHSLSAFRKEKNE